MLSRAIVNKKINKKGISIMIGYILLIALSVVMSLIVYQWIKTYVPKDTAKCADGVSVFIKDAEYTCTEEGKSESLKLTLKNNGKFDVAGYFIHVTDKPEQELAIIDISGNITTGGTLSQNAVVFVDGENGMTPGEEGNEKTSEFDFILKNPTTLLPKFYKVEIIPVRYQEEEGKLRFVSCSSARVNELLNCE